MPTCATRKPLNSPHSEPMISATPIASGIATTSDMPAPPSPARRVRTIAARIDDRFAAPTTERSMPPEIIVSMMAIARIPNSGNWTAMDCRLTTLKNLPGSRMANAPKMRIAISSKRNTGLPLKRRDMKERCVVVWFISVTHS